MQPITTHPIAHRASAWRQLGRSAWLAWVLFWLVSAPVTYMLGASIWRMLALTAATFAAIEGIDALRRWFKTR